MYDNVWKCTKCTKMYEMIPAAFCNAGRLFVSQSVSQSVCWSISVNSSGSAKPIRTGPTPKDAPELGKDDGVGHVAPRVTCDPPRAAAWEVRRKKLTRLQPKRGVAGSPNFQARRALVWLKCHGVELPRWCKSAPAGRTLAFSPFAL